MTLAADGNVAAMLSDFGGDPQRAEDLAEFLGFQPISNPEDRLAGALSGGLKQFLRGRGDGGFGVSELYRVGSCKADPAEAGLWIGVLSDWGYRSSDRGPVATAHHPRSCGARPRQTIPSPIGSSVRRTRAAKLNLSSPACRLAAPTVQ